MLLQVLRHGESPDLLLSKDRGHGLIGGEHLLHLGVLEVLLLQVSPEPLDTLKEKERVINCERNEAKFPT